MSSFSDDVRGFTDWLEQTNALSVVLWAAAIIFVLRTLWKMYPGVRSIIRFVEVISSLQSFMLETDRKFEVLFDKLNIDIDATPKSEQGPDA
jgi:hypothetical protein